MNAAPVRPDYDEFSRLSADATVVPVTRELLADDLTPLTALAAMGDAPGSYLLESVSGGETWARYSFVGTDPELLVRGAGDRYERVVGDRLEVETGVDPFECLRADLARYQPPVIDWLPRFWGGAVGYVSYDAVRRFEPTVADPLPSVPGQYELSFAIGGTLIVFDNQRQTVRVVALCRVGDGIDGPSAYAAAIARLDAAEAKLASAPRLSRLAPPDKDAETPLPASSFDEASFCAAVEEVQEHIRAGDIFQLVLSQRFRVPQAGTDPLDVYRAMRVLNPSPYMYFVRFPEVTIAGASPETLVRLEDGVVQVRPIAGTRHRGATAPEDDAIAEELLADPKERAEHVMLVDLGRNDVGRISEGGTVEITEQMNVERYSHVMHIVSNVTGKIAAGRDALDVLRATFPAGTLSGAPKVRAMQLIDELEPAPRGIYGGAVGYIGFDGNLDLAIAIRTVLATGGDLILQAGAGIVEASDPKAEYVETINKARAGLLAIAAARQVNSGD